VQKQPDHRDVKHIRAWKLFTLTSRMILARPKCSGNESRRLLLTRVTRFLHGDWCALLDEAQESIPTCTNRNVPKVQAAVLKQRLQRACDQVKLGEVSAARQVLTSPDLAPGTAETLEQLTNVERRPLTPVQPIPDAILNFVPNTQLDLDLDKFFVALRSARKRSAAGLSGMSASHLKVLLDDEASLHRLGIAASAFARAAVPSEIAQGLALARLTALRKPNGGVRGIATGDILRRLVSKALARQFADRFTAATAPYQFGLQTRAGCDAVASLLRAVTDEDPDATVICLDGIGAFDHVSRKAFLQKLCEIAPALMPFVMQFYSRQSTYFWWDDHGVRHTVLQGEGCEQGDALAPALFSLALHAALAEASSKLHADEFLVAYLDDLYLVTKPDRASEAFNTTAGIVHARAGVQCNLGKCYAYNRSGADAPQGIAELGEEVWRSNRTLSERGIVVLGVPVGSKEFCASHTGTRMADEQDLLDLIPQLPDMQSAWLILSMCAVPRANHILRSLPPSDARHFAACHDDAIWNTFLQILGEKDDVSNESLHMPRLVASLPGGLGGLGLRSAQRTAAAAYWAGWADALSVLQTRRPVETARFLRHLEDDSIPAPACLEAARQAAATLDREGWNERPSWKDLAAGIRPPVGNETSLGFWSPGWQHHSSLARETFFRETVVFPSLSPSGQAMLCSQKRTSFLCMACGHTY